jgi:hypothetical protein
MSKQNNTITRRSFLKGAAYTSALSMGGFASVALANPDAPKEYIVSGGAVSAITLFNQSAKTVALDASKPVSLEKVNGWVVVKINKASQQGSSDITTLLPGQKLSFAVDADLAPMLTETGGEIAITNEYSALDNMVPIATYNSMVA